MVEIPEKKKWISTDAWRGYFSFDNSVADGWFATMEDETTRGHNAGEKERIKKIQTALKKAKIPSKMKTTTTSNVFSVGWDVLVPVDKVKMARKLAEEVI